MSLTGYRSVLRSTRGYSVMQRYWNDPDQTADAIDSGRWMHTGDLATLDTEGYCNIVGRIKDMVIRGGENIYPREIEEFLYRHPKIQDVQVIGVPDRKYGEELCAWVKLKAGRRGERRRNPAILRGADRPLQNPALCAFRGRFSDDGDR